MRRTRLFCLSMAIILLLQPSAHAQDDIISKINSYGNFDRWCVREIEESGIIGGQTKYLYEFYGQPADTLRTGKEPFKAPDGYVWRTNNVLAIVAGVTKTNNTVYPEKRGDGYCARIETHIEEVKALGIVNMDVTCQGVMLVGSLPEPIKDTKSPMSKVDYGFSFNGRPAGVRLDFKADVGHDVIRATGFSKKKNMGEPDWAEFTVVLQKRWEDEDGKVHALRVGTGIERIMEDVPEWKNGHMIDIHYGDITAEAFYQDYMGLKTDPDLAWYTINSKGKNVLVHEEGWAEPGTEPNHMMIYFISSCGKAFHGGVGNTLWIDNVEVVM